MTTTGHAPAPAPPGGAAAARPVRRERHAGRFVLGALLILVGLLWLLDAAGISDVRYEVALPAALTVVGVALLATARRGTHGGLVAAGIVLSVLLLFSPVMPPTTAFGGVGDRVEQPDSVAELAPAYELGMGTLTIDLRDLGRVPDGTALTASVGMGELVVRLPEGMGAQVKARSGMGEVVVDRTAREGIGPNFEQEIPGSPTVHLDLSVGMGKVEVVR